MLSGAAERVTPVPPPPRALMRLIAFVACALPALVTVVRPAAAQSDSTTACTYTTCALRAEPGFFGNVLVRGADGETVAHLGWRADLKLLTARTDSSGVYARRYRTDTRWSTAFGLLSIGALIVAGAQTDPYGSVWPSNGTLTALTVGLVSLSASVPFGIRAQRSLSRAVWWYNRSLPRP